MTTEEFNIRYIPLQEGLYRLAFHFLESQEEAEDLVQELYLKLLSNKDSLDYISNPKAYSITLLRNLCLDKLRKKSRSKQSSLDKDIGGEITAEDELITKEKLTKVLAEIKKLPQKQQEILRMKIQEEMSYEDIAKKTGMSNLSIRVLISTVRKKLKTAL